MTGVPQACASTTEMPKSSSAANRKARACCMVRRMASNGRWPITCTLGPAAWRTLSSSGPVPTMTSLRSGILAKASAISGTRL
ncbi:hypothetical protein D3C87_1489420 [compost metagenome]